MQRDLHFANDLADDPAADDAQSPHLHDADYQRIERAIVHVHQHFLRQPSLDELASVAALSPAHFNRLFRRWAGITPKQFLQRLTLDAAKTQLRVAHSVMRAALESGLSGPGRLHDLFVTLEAVTPGEYKSGGQQLVLRHGIAATPFGPARLVWSTRGLSQLHFVRAEQPLPALATEWPQAELIEDDAGAAVQVADLWQWSQQPAQPLRLMVRGTNFQVQVWRALLELGTTGFTHYGQLALQLQRASAARAVGNAVGANPLPWLIPCHRVLHANGGLGGYSGGLDRKKVILAWEYARHAVSS